MRFLGTFRRGHYFLYSTNRGYDDMERRIVQCIILHKKHIIENIYMSILLDGIMITVLRAAARNWNTTPQANFCPDSRTSERKTRLAAGHSEIGKEKRLVYIFVYSSALQIRLF
jgi:hypothetical protein